MIFLQHLTIFSWCKTYLEVSMPNAKYFQHILSEYEYNVQYQMCAIFCHTFDMSKDALTKDIFIKNYIKNFNTHCILQCKPAFYQKHFKIVVIFIGIYQNNTWDMRIYAKTFLCMASVPAKGWPNLDIFSIKLDAYQGESSIKISAP